MLDQILPCWPFRQHGSQEFACGVELMKTWEDDLLDLLLFVLLSHQVTAKDFEPAMSLPNLFPQICGPMSAVWVHWIAGRSVVTLVERQKPRGWAFQLGDHVDFAVADGKMD